MILVKPYQYEELISDALCSINDRLYYHEYTGRGSSACGTFCQSKDELEPFVMFFFWDNLQ